MIQLFQLNRIWQEIREQALAEIDQTCSQGFAQKGSSVDFIESWLKSYSGKKYAVTMASCTDALTTIIQSLNLEKNSKIAVTCYSFFATASAIIKSGHTPVFVDVDNHYRININQIPNDCAAVIVVDLFGYPINYSMLDNIAIPVIMDAAQSLETYSVYGKSVAQGIASAVSFSPTKTIPTFGSGGAVVTNDDGIADFALRWRTHGKYNNQSLSSTIGANSMLSSMEAAQLKVAIQHSPRWLLRRKHIAASFFQSIRSHRLTKPNYHEGHSWHKFVITCNTEATRNELAEHLKINNIQSEIYYKHLLHKEPLLVGENITLPNSERLVKCTLAIPCQHTLSDAEVELICKALESFE